MFLISFRIFPWPAMVAAIAGFAKRVRIAETALSGVVSETVVVRIELVDQAGVATSKLDPEDELPETGFVVNLKMPSDFDGGFRGIHIGGSESILSVEYTFTSNVAQTATISVAGLAGRADNGLPGCPPSWNCSDTVEVTFIPGMNSLYPFLV